MEEKLCSKCKVVKPTNQFRRLYEGYRSECKECYKEYINRNKETIKAKKAEYYKRKKEEKMKAEKSSNIKLFEYIYESVLESGGDGDVAVVFTAQNHRVVADEFEKFLKTKPFGCWQRTNQEDGDVVFYDQQESFVFSNHDHFCYWRELRGPNPVTDKTPCTQKVITP